MIASSVKLGLASEAALYEPGDKLLISGGIRCIVKKRVVDLDSYIISYEVEWESGNTGSLDQDEIDSADVIGSVEPPYEW